MKDHCFTKAHWIKARDWPHIHGRLEDVRMRPLPGVHPLRAWSAVPDGAGWALITEQDWLPWPSLSQVAAHAHPLRRIQLAQKLLALTEFWQTKGFIHGDLSPNNILVVSERSMAPRLIAVDWVLNLKSREGTPRYVPPSLAQRNKCMEHDVAAAQLIAQELGHRPF